MFKKYEELTECEMWALVAFGLAALVAHFVWSYIL